MDDVAEANGGVFERLVEVRDAGRAPERVASRDQFHSLVRRPRRRDGARRGYAYVRVRLEVFANPHGKVRGKRRGEKRILGTDGKLAKRRLVGSSRRESGTPRIFLVGSPTPRVVLHHDPLSLVHVPAAHEHTRETRRERLVERHLERVRSRGFRHDLRRGVVQTVETDDVRKDDAVAGGKAVRGGVAHRRHECVAVAGETLEHGGERSDGSSVARPRASRVRDSERRQSRGSRVHHGRVVGGRERVDESWIGRGGRIGVAREDDGVRAVERGARGVRDWGDGHVSGHLVAFGRERLGDRVDSALADVPVAEDDVRGDVVRGHGVVRVVDQHDLANAAQRQEARGLGADQTRADHDHSRAAQGAHALLAERVRQRRELGVRARLRYRARAMSLRRVVPRVGHHRGRHAGRDANLGRA